MDKTSFIDKLNDMLFEEQRIFKVHRVSLIKNKVVRLILIVEARMYDKYLDDDLQQKVEKNVKKILPSVFELEISYKKNFYRR